MADPLYISRPSLKGIGLNHANYRFGHNPAGSPPLSGRSGGWPSVPDLAPVPSSDGGVDGTDRPVGTNETDRVSRPSLFGNFGQALGDIASGATYVRSSDPFLAFAQGFAGERAASGSRSRQAYLDKQAADDKKYQRDLEQKKLNLESRRVDAYEQSVGAKAGKGKLVDDGGKNLTDAGEAYANEKAIKAHDSAVLTSIAAGNDSDLTKSKGEAAGREAYSFSRHQLVGSTPPDQSFDVASGGEPSSEEAEAASRGDGSGDSSGSWLPPVDPNIAAEKGAPPISILGSGEQGFPNKQSPGIDVTLGGAGAAVASPAVSGTAAPKRPTVDLSHVPPQAIALLKAHPEARAQFDQKYGAGAAAAVLGQ